MNPQNPLAELKDIHLPTPAPWWDLALGWWFLLILAVGLLIWGIPQTYRWFKQRKKRNILLRDMQVHLTHIQEVYQKEQQTHLTLTELSIFLRRISITLFGEAEIAGLIGKPWVNFLDAQWGDSQPPHLFASEAIAPLLQHVAYQKPGEYITDEQVKQVLQLTQDWLQVVVKHHV